MALHSSRRKEDGSFALHYDPKIAEIFKKGPIADVDLWMPWDQIKIPTLLLRGVQSDILPADVAQAMTQRGPHARLVEFPGIGHAPALMAQDQVTIIRDFLRG